MREAPNVYRVAFYCATAGVRIRKELCQYFARNSARISISGTSMSESARKDRKTGRMRSRAESHVFP